ncbi:MAG: cytochrome C biogenesis protein [Proteobacteria bacterium]|nr:cytochrome C biogenesis protein [Pseudomonadota bacterium]
MTAINLTRLVLVTGAALLAQPGIVPAHAADASAWDEDIRSAVRLIGGEQNGAAATRRAGVQFRITRGWKTYWRYPGDAGVPPRFDFSRSENVKAVAVRFPAPRRFAESDGQTIGYSGDVVLPLAVEAQDAAKPVTLRLDLDYAVCEKVCIPAKGKAELVLAAGSSAHEAALAAAEATVPVPAKLGEFAPFYIRAVRQEADAKTVIVDVMAPEHFKVDLFVEGPTPDWALPLPELVPGAPAGARRFAFKLEGLPAAVSPKGAILKLTAVAGARAIEVDAALD